MSIMIHLTLTIMLEVRRNKHMSHLFYQFPAFFGDPDQMRRGCADYFGAFDICGAENIKDPERQYMVGIHPHGPMAFSRMYFISGFRDLFKGPITNDVSCIFGGVFNPLPSVSLPNSHSLHSFDQKLAYPPSTPEC